MACSSPRIRGGNQAERVVGRRGAHVGELLSFVMFTSKIVGARVLADEHAARRPPSRLDEDLPRSWQVREMALGRGRAGRSAASAPVAARRIGPCQGSQAAKTWWKIPVPACR